MRGEMLLQRYLSFHRLKMASWAIVRFVIVFGLCFVILYPLLLKLLNALMSPEDFIDPTVRYIPRELTTYYIEKAWSQMQFMRSAATTLMLSLVVSVLQLLVCTIAGYGFARFQFKGKALLFGAVMFTLLVPPHTIMTSLFMNFRFFNVFGFQMNLIDTFWPFLILSATGLGLKNGLYIYLLRQFFIGMPKELEEAAYMDGSGPMRTFFRIMLPNSVPMLITVFVFSFSWQWTDTFYSGLFFNNLMTLSKALLANIQFVQTDPIEYSVLRNTGSLLIIAPLLLIFVVAQRKLIQGIERSGLVG